MRHFMVIFATRFLVSLFVLLLTARFVLLRGIPPGEAVLFGFMANVLANLLGDICISIIGPPRSPPPPEE